MQSKMMRYFIDRIEQEGQEVRTWTPGDQSGAEEFLSNQRPLWRQFVGVNDDLSMRHI